MDDWQCCSSRIGKLHCQDDLVNMLQMYLYRDVCFVVVVVCILFTHKVTEHKGREGQGEGERERYCGNLYHLCHRDTWAPCGNRTHT